MNCNNIFEFISSAKGGSQFKWLVNTLQESGVIGSSLLSARVVRYYIGGNSSISKMWLKDKDEKGEPVPSGFNLLNASQPVTLCQNINNENIIVTRKGPQGENVVLNYPDLNKWFYVNECEKIINNLINDSSTSII